MSTPLRVVVVDDSVDIRELIVIALSRIGRYEVVGEAGDGRDAVERCAAEHPDLVLLDLSMPVMDGLEALPLIHDCAPQAQVVMLSGYAESTAGAAAREAGAVGYIEKDNLLRSLVPSLDSVLASSSSEGTPLSSMHPRRPT